MTKAATWYLLFLLITLLFLVLATIPILASDLFRQPYSPLWPTVYRAMDLFRIDPFPTGGGAPPKFPYWRDPADASIYFRHVPLTSADGVELDAWYAPAISSTTTAATDTPTILLVHGLFERKGSMLHLVPWFHRAGYNVLALDTRGHGKSEKRPTTIGREEVMDVQAALDWLESEGVSGRVGGLGMSMGAAVLVNTAAQDERLDALVLDSMFADWADTDFAEGYRLPPEWLVPEVPNPVELMPRIDVPVFIIHGTADILVDLDHAERLYEATDAPKSLWINDSGHAWSSWTYPDIYRQKVFDFFDIAFDHELESR